jgi:hypothetical protein
MSIHVDNFLCGRPGRWSVHGIYLAEEKKLGFNKDFLLRHAKEKTGFIAGTINV